MMQIETNKADLWKDIQELADMPLSPARASKLVAYMEAYDSLCRVACARESIAAPVAMESRDTPHFTRQMAEEWTSNMENRDGTKGPHFSQAKVQELMQQYGIDQDPTKFWVALNATYSDMCAFFRKHNINTIDAYLDHTLDFWFRDQDSVDDKLSAYYTHVVKH